MSMSLFGFVTLVALPIQPFVDQWVALAGSDGILWSALQLLYLHISMQSQQRKATL